MKVKKETKRVNIKERVIKITRPKITPRKLVVRKIVAKKLVATHVASRKRKVQVKKIVTISPKASVKSHNLFFTHDFMRHVALTIILALGVVSLGHLDITNAFYNDAEASSDNSFITGSLDFLITYSGFETAEPHFSFNPGTTTSKTIAVTLETNSNPIKYHASTTNVSGDVPFCDAISVDAGLDGQSQYMGSLTDFVSPATTTASSWKYDFSMSPGAGFYNNICTFNFEYSGRQTAPHNEYEDGGYYDTETSTSTIYSWGFRINKVYYDVDTDERGTEQDNEWVEIYNQTDTALDINGWQICDNGGCDTLASSSPIMIPAKGYGVITASNTTWNYWELANGVVPIVLSGLNSLSNTGDRLILKRPDGIVMDEMNWGTDTGVWNPASPDVPEGHTLGRRPNGYDTNQASDFVDLAPPTLNLINPDQSGLLTWYWTYNYNILWNAINLNGPNDALKINLSYLKDIDGSATMTPGDESVGIASGLENTGSYSWDLPSGFLGYIWVKITAFGPENPMLNTSMISGKIYDPFPIDTFLLDLRGEPEEEVLGAMTPALPEEEVEEVVEVETVPTVTPEAIAEPVAEPITEIVLPVSDITEEPVVELVTPVIEPEEVIEILPVPVEVKEPEPEPMVIEEAAPVAEPVVPEVTPVTETVVTTPEPEVITP
ncbi:MAG: lamin tail domain-containing protein [Candidatus Pacebacteria bacterium]|nr:lamin tail domain-containing protein [Candidatus Paceibacterota bacterium]